MVGASGVIHETMSSGKAKVSLGMCDKSPSFFFFRKDDHAGIPQVRACTCSIGLPVRFQVAEIGFGVDLMAAYWIRARNARSSMAALTSLRPPIF